MRGSTIDRGGMMGHGSQAMNMDRMEQFTRAYRNLSQFPLFSEKDVEKFRVTYGQATLGLLRRKILAMADNDKLIFTGHRGCGKSTLLGQLAQQMRQDGLFVAGFSIAAMVEMSDVNHINLLYSIALQLLEQASSKQVSIPESTANRLLNWFTQTKSRVYTDQLKQEISVGANIFDFFKAKLQKEGAFREEIKETFENKVSDLSQQIDLIAGEIQAATQKQVLVIIDDLDKLDLPVIRSVFQENIQSLMSPNIRVVFTIPIAVVREPGLMTTLDPERTVLLGVPKFFPRETAHQPNATPIEANVEVLKKVLEKRIPEDLIEPDIKRQIVLLSGGVLREMVRLGRECCLECMVQMDVEPETTNIKIDKDILAKAVKSIRNQYARPLGSNLYSLLAQTYQAFSPPDAKSADFLEMLHGLYVLEYENDELWYDLHPLVVDLLRRRGLIDA
ncbi:NACHT domain-containing protein [Leptolyngbya sp. BC1307]|uniref:NACHT domain-containing protein n=1 Tax=Leptolyngbya sp. BC1307 TaxID=2029589 RepID=UPI001F0A344B|nr:NACHT domain-containing protein [Leptolyngbya sp. BC1307]